MKAGSGVKYWPKWFIPLYLMYLSLCFLRDLSISQAFVVSAKEETQWF